MNATRVYKIIGRFFKSSKLQLITVKLCSFILVIILLNYSCASVEHFGDIERDIKRLAYIII